MKYLILCLFSVMLLDAQVKQFLWKEDANGKAVPYRVNGKNINLDSAGVYSKAQTDSMFLVNTPDTIALISTIWKAKTLIHDSLLRVFDSLNTRYSDKDTVSTLSTKAYAKSFEADTTNKISTKWFAKKTFSDSILTWTNQQTKTTSTPTFNGLMLRGEEGSVPNASIDIVNKYDPTGYYWLFKAYDTGDTTLKSYLDQMGNFNTVGEITGTVLHGDVAQSHVTNLSDSLANRWKISDTGSVLASKAWVSGKGLSGDTNGIHGRYTSTYLVEKDGTTNSLYTNVDAVDSTMRIKHRRIEQLYTSKTKSLLHLDGDNGSTTITDELGHLWTPNNATISTTKSKFGVASVYMNNGGLSTGTSNDYAFGTGDFTIEFWFNCKKAEQLADYHVNLVDIGGIAVYFNRVGESGAGNFYFGASVGFSRDAITAGFSDSTWVHVAAVRYNSTCKIYVNGTTSGSTQTATSTYNYPSAYAQIGFGSYGSAYVGYMDEVRISNSARYTADFTPSTSAFSVDYEISYSEGGDTLMVAVDKADTSDYASVAGSLDADSIGVAKVSSDTLISKRITLKGDGSIEARGSYGAGLPITATTGTMLAWNPCKSSLRIGYFTGSDISDIGAYSSAFGYRSTAAGLYGFSTGYKTIAYGEGAFTAGSETEANAGAFAFGLHSRAYGAYSISGGDHNIAWGNASVVLGYYSSTLLGTSGGVAIGHGVSSTANYATALGVYNVGLADSSLLEIGNGTGSGTRSNALTILSNGSVHINDTTGSEMLTVTGGNVKADTLKGRIAQSYVNNLSDSLSKFYSSGDTMTSGGLVINSQLITPFSVTGQEGEIMSINGTGDGVTISGLFSVNGQYERFNSEYSMLGVNSDTCLYVDADGTVTLRGNATVFNDLMFPFESGASGGAPYPTFNADSMYYNFVVDSTGITKCMQYFTIQMPHWWKEGSTIYPHVHYKHETAVGTPTWTLKYRWINIGDNAPVPYSYKLLSSTTSTTDKTHAMSYSTTGISGAGKTFSSILTMAVYLNTISGTGTVHAWQFDLHVEQDALGTKQELVK